MHSTLKCTLITPERLVLDDEVVYASIPAWDGLIGLAPDRAPLLVKLGPGLLRLDYQQGGSRWFFISGGFAQMKDNLLTLLADQALSHDQVNQQQAQDALTQSLTAVPLLDENRVARKQLSTDRARAMLRLLEHPPK